MKIKKNLQSLLLTFLAISASLTAFSQYTLQDSDVTITDGVIQSCTYEGGEPHIIIPETLSGQTVTGINYGNISTAVFGEMGLTQVEMPSGIQTIGANAFWENTIELVNLHECVNLQVIEIQAFHSNHLTEVNLSGNPNLTSIQSAAFFSQTDGSLTEVDLSDCSSLISIGNSAFSNNQISSLNLSNCTSLEVIEAGAFSSNNLSLVNLSSCTSLMKIEASAFATNNMTGFSLPVHSQYNSFGWVDNNGNEYQGGDFVTDLSLEYRIPVTYTIQDEDVVITDGVIIEFNYDYEITSITIPPTLQGQNVIGIADNDTEGVFEEKGITEVIFPSSLQFIGNRAFYNNEITILNMDNCTQFERFGKSAFMLNSITDLVLNCHESLVSIEQSAFYGNELGDIDLSGFSNLPSIGFGAFYMNWNGSHGHLNLSGCSSLETIEEQAFYCTGIESINFEGCESLRIIDQSAFQYCAIINLDLSPLSSLEIIETTAFAYNEIESVNMQGCENLYMIRYGAFAINDSLYSMQLPEVDNGSIYFWRDSNDEIYTGGDLVDNFINEFCMPVYTLKDEDVMMSNGEITECLIDFPVSDAHVIFPEILNNQPVLRIADGEYFAGDSHGIFEDKAIERVYLPSGIVSIGDYAFKGNRINSFEMGGFANLLDIGMEAFADNNIEILNVNGYSLMNIDEYAFYNNDISSVNMSSATALNHIGNYAFALNDISSLTLENAEQLQTIGHHAFYGNNLENFILPTPNISGFTFSQWVGSNSSTYAGGSSVNNFYIGYSAELISTGYSVTLTITDGTNPIPGAIVSMGTYGDRISDSDGIVNFESVENGSYFYSVSAINYEDLTDQVIVNGSDLTQDVELSQASYQVEFNLTSNGNPVASTNIVFGGLIYTSDTNGYVLIEDLLPGSYDYNITDASYQAVIANLDIVAVNLEINIELERIYSVIFTISDGSSPIENAVIDFNGSIHTTNSAGQTVVNGLSEETHTYTIEAEGFMPYSSDVIISGEDISLNIELEKVFTLSFNISDGVNPIQNANLILNGTEYNSDSNGYIIIESLLAGSYNYEVSANNYNSVNDIITIESNTTVDILLEQVFQVEFYVTDGVFPIENAVITFNGEIYHSNFAGFAIIENLIADTYNYTISADGFGIYEGSLIVSDDNIQEIISLTPTTIQETEYGNISIYPNPTNGLIHLSGLPETSVVEIYNISGSLIKLIQNQPNESIDLSDFETGIYILKLTHKESSTSITRRIVKQ